MKPSTTNSTSTMRILINLSSQLIGEALKELLASASGNYHTLVARDHESVLDFSPQKILVDIQTIGRNHLKRWPDAKLILVDTGQSDEEIIVNLLSNKIYGVISKDTNTALFTRALETIHNGQVWVDNQKIKALLHHHEATRLLTSRNSLSKREKEIVVLISQGNKNKEIAHKLFISEQTVKAHISRIFRKYNVSSRAQLVPLAMEYQLKPDLAFALFPKKDLKTSPLH